MICYQLPFNNQKSKRFCLNQSQHNMLLNVYAKCKGHYVNQIINLVLVMIKELEMNDLINYCQIFIFISNSQVQCKMEKQKHHKHALWEITLFFQQTYITLNQNQIIPTILPHYYNYQQQLHNDIFKKYKVLSYILRLQLILLLIMIQKYLSKYFKYYSIFLFDFQQKIQQFMVLDKMQQLLVEFKAQHILYFRAYIKLMIIKLVTKYISSQYNIQAFYILNMMIRLTTRLMRNISFPKNLSSKIFSLENTDQDIENQIYDFPYVPYYKIIPGLYATFPGNQNGDQEFIQTRSKRHRVAKLKRARRKHGKKTVIR